MKRELEASIRYIQAIDVELKDRVGEISAALEKLVDPQRTNAATRAPQGAQKTRVDTPSAEPAEANGLKPRHRDILKAIVRYEQMGNSSVTSKRLAAAVGFAMSGTWSTYLSHLSSGGFIQRSGGQITITDEGRAAAGDVGELVTHKDIMALWHSKLEPRYRDILDRVVDVHPESISNADLAAAVGLTQSGTFSTYLSRLSTLGLIDRDRGQVRASEHLFP